MCTIECEHCGDPLIVVRKTLPSATVLNLSASGHVKPIGNERNVEQILTIERIVSVHRRHGPIGIRTTGKDGESSILNMWSEIASSSKSAIEECAIRRSVLTRPPLQRWTRQMEHLLQRLLFQQGLTVFSLLIRALWGGLHGSCKDGCVEER